VSLSKGRGIRFVGIPFGHPAQIVVALYAVNILLATFILMLPLSSQGTGGTDFLTAFFTATSALTVTGLGLVGTETYWSGWGQSVILLLIQTGGLGIMTLASTLVVLLNKRLELRHRLTTLIETGAIGMGDFRDVLRNVIKLTVVFEAGISIVLALRFWAFYDESLGRAIWLGTFHGISAWNNAGFALYDTSLTSFSADIWILLPVAIAIIAGGLGYPVLLDIKKHPTRHQKWSLHSKMTVWTSVGLLLTATLLIVWFEWSNSQTLGPLAIEDKLLTGSFSSVTARTAGFNVIDVGGLEPPTMFILALLMFIGGGSASTAGGIKVTTFALLILIALTEIRGHQDTNAFAWRIPLGAQRQAVAVAVISMASVFAALFGLLAWHDGTVEDLLFEAFSAFGTVGLSTGITPELDGPGQVLIIILMFLGRLGPLTLGSTLLFNNRERLYRFPEDRPMIG